MSEHYSVQKILNIFGADINRNTLIEAEKQGRIPKPERQDSGAYKRRAWTIAELPQIGERYGFLSKFSSPVAISIFTSKGGVLKSAIAMNLARMAALHNIKTCVVGLDFQGDISTALGQSDDIEDSEDMEAALARVQSTRGLYDFYEKKDSSKEGGRIELSDLIQTTDIPTLHFIPETPELVQLDQELINENRREYWLKDYVVDPLKKHYDLVLMDCSPNWNKLVTNALVACDVLISPLECKINNFRNYTVLRPLLTNFRTQLKLSFAEIFVPTRFTSTRKLSVDIKKHYVDNVPGCTNTTIRENVYGEEAMAMKLSLPEYSPTKLQADEMRELLKEIWGRISEKQKRESQAPSVSATSHTSRDALVNHSVSV